MLGSHDVAVTGYFFRYRVLAAGSRATLLKISNVILLY